MAKIIELYTSREGTKGESREFHFLFVDYLDEDEVDAGVEASKFDGTIPPFFDGLAYQTYRLSSKGGDVWEVVALYGKLELQQTGSYSYQFTTGGKTIKRESSLQTMASFPVLATGDLTNINSANPAEVTTSAAHGLTTGDSVTISDLGQIGGPMLGSPFEGQWTIVVTATNKFTIPVDGTGTSSPISGTWTRAGAPNFNKLIGVNGSKIDGVEVPGPGFGWSETWIVPKGTVTTLYVDTVSRMNGMVNLFPFRGFSSGEVMFEFLTGGKRSGEDLSLTFNFERQFDAVNVPAGHLIIPYKPGWDYVWTLKEEDKYEEAGTLAILAPRVRAAYVERVAYYADFSVLGIGYLPIWEFP